MAVITDFIEDHSHVIQVANIHFCKHVSIEASTATSAKMTSKDQPACYYFYWIFEDSLILQKHWKVQVPRALGDVSKLVGLRDLLLKTCIDIQIVWMKK